MFKKVIGNPVFLNRVNSKQTRIAGVLKLSFWLAIVALVSCKGVDTYDGSSDGRGELTVSLAADGVDYVQVVTLTVTGLTITPVGGADIDLVFDDAIELDLLSLEVGDSEKLLDEYLLDIGVYESITLVIDPTLSSVELNGDMFDLTVKAGFEIGLKSNINFEVKDDSDFDFTITLDLGKSLAEIVSSAPVAYELLPSLRIVDTEKGATISGTVASALVEDDDCDNNGVNHQDGNVVYIFNGAGAAIQDIQTNVGDPVATTLVISAVGSSSYQFDLAFLNPGTYSVVFSCDGAIDELQAINFISMEFSDLFEVTLSSGGMESVDIE